MNKPKQDNNQNITAPTQPSKRRNWNRRNRKKKKSIPKVKNIRLIHMVPNVLTSLNIACGVSSIIYSVEGQYEIAAWLIVVAAFFDLVDGKVARYVGSTSQFGMQLDSLADAVSFGVAPPILIRAILYQGYHRLGLSLVLVYTLCTILRLARYNVQANNKEARKGFTGLPCPVPACFLAGIVLVCLEFQINMTLPGMRIGLHALIVGLSCLMVSTIPYPDIASSYIQKQNVYQHSVVLALLLAVAVLIAKISIVMISAAFIISGPIYAIQQQIQASRSKQEAYNEEWKHNPSSK